MLRLAGVPVTAARYQGIICGVVVPDALGGTRAAEAAVGDATVVLRKAPKRRLRPAAAGRASQGQVVA